MVVFAAMVCATSAKHKRALAVMAGLSLLAASGLSWAQSPEERSGARAAATQGANAFMDGRWSEAVDLFTRAESLVHSPVHLLYLARSYAKLGKLVRAREYYIQLAGEDVSHAADVVREAKQQGEQELQELEPRVPYVSVVVQGAGPKPVKVVMDGEQVPPALLGVPRPVDPGDHKFQAFAENMESSVTSMSISEGRSETVVLTLVPVAGAPSKSGTKPGGATPAGGAPAEAGADKEPAAGPPIFPLVAFGVGAVGLGVGTIFALVGKSKVDDANEICNLSGGACPADRRSEVEDLDDSARSANTISTIGFIAGGLGIAAGVTLLFIGPGAGPAEREAASSPSITPQVGLGWAGVSGEF